jgi:hypothetical protein
VKSTLLKRRGVLTIGLFTVVVLSLLRACFCERSADICDFTCLTTSLRMFSDSFPIKTDMSFQYNQEGNSEEQMVKEEHNFFEASFKFQI